MYEYGVNEVRQYSGYITEIKPTVFLQHVEVLENALGLGETIAYVFFIQSIAKNTQH